ncbi:putative late blight resistance protein homolog R1A-3 [Coffea arabica]|uniref:Late blight resistance protein homolog R1A-3 n=1 Tax=Coffea arabica TaxID=13443 RepID=A0A6P6UZA9_COFAR|nr:putative late blight resistance protein homolog R1A-3 [Coffea arabica]
MDRTCVDSAIEQLSKLLTLPRLTSTTMEIQVKALLLDLRFVKMFFCCLTTFKPADDQETMMVASMELTTARATLEAAGCKLYQAGFFASFGLDIQDWETLVSDLLQIVEHLKPEVREICLDVLVHHSGNSNSKPSCTNEETLDFVDSILLNLKRLSLIVNNNNNMVPDLKKQMEALEEKLKFTRDFLDFTERRCGRSNDRLEDLFTIFQAWTKNAAFLSLMYWVELDIMDQNMAHQMNTVLSDSLQEIMRCTPRVIQMYLGLLKASKTSREDILPVGEILARFVSFLPLENLVDSVEGDDIAIFRTGLIFLISFLMDLPKELQKGAARRNESLKLIEVARRNAFLKQIEAAIYKVASLISMGGDSFVPTCLEKMHKIMTQVKKHHFQMPKSSASNCPKTDGMGFVCSILINLEEIMKSNATNFFLFAKHIVGAIHRELHALWLLQKGITHLQNGYQYKKLRSLLAQTINVAYRAEHVVRSRSVVDRPIWYHLMCLSDVLEEIKIIKTAVGKIRREVQTSKKISFCAQTSINCTQLSSRTNASNVDEVAFPLTDEADAIINLLMRGSLGLSIVSVVGMPGVGKTTLAKAAYNNLSVKMRFHKLAWCSVSDGTQRSGDLLLDILKCTNPVKAKTDEDLALEVRRSLLKERYLIVLDDIWEIGAWDAIKLSLPNDKNGSRILLTSQNHNLGLQTGLPHNVYPLSVLNDERSWKLLEKMLFHNHGCPPHLLGVGQKIASNCKGLPLALAASAVLLRREEQNLDRWGRIEESSNPGIAGKGFMDILELSYKRLPDHLKPCFLYFGSLQAGKEVSAQKLILLWIAEGFIQKAAIGSIGSLEVLGRDYLIELIDHSLVDVTKRSSDGGIKACRVNELLHSFCVEKAQEENFLHVDWSDRSDLSHGSSTRTMHYPYRLCIRSKWETFMQPKPIGRHLYSLLACSKISRHQSYLRSVAFEHFHSFKLLYILNLEGIYLDISFPQEIMSIVHLRHLAIRGSFTRIPSSIANLWNLRSLVVKGVRSLISLPEVILKMKSLKHVKISEKAVISLGDHELEDSSLQVNYIKTFSTLALHHVADSENLLRKLTGLQKLRCVVSGSQLYSNNKVQFPASAYLKDLQSLTLSTLDYEGLVSCSWLHNQFQTFNFPSTLKKLTLYRLGLPWRGISMIMQLENLEVLKLREQAFMGNRWHMKLGKEEFRNLKFLELSNLDIRQWRGSDIDPFPCLEGLVVKDCHRLLEVPLCLGRTATLQMIELRQCSDSVKKLAKDILEEQVGYWGNNELKLLILDS